MNEILQLDTRCLFEASMSASLLFIFFNLILLFLLLDGQTHLPADQTSFFETDIPFVRMRVCKSVCVCVQIINQM